MRTKVFIQISAVVLSTTILLSSCASTTMIQSTPSGAKLYMNGEQVGTTPYTHTDTKIVGSTTTIRLVVEGYQDFYSVLQRNEQLSVGALIGGIFVLVPFLWIMEYKPSHMYELTPLNK